jgi:hypothetical protein
MIGYDDEEGSRQDVGVAMVAPSKGGIVVA